MIECIFTLDYEVYGNGRGSLRELVVEPTEALAGIFERHRKRFVVFAEAAELELLEEGGREAGSGEARAQLRRLHGDGHEIALHLHPQWYNARYREGRWLLDEREYNLCTLPAGRIAEIVDRALAYLRRLLGQADFTPLSFRGGNWLFQPTQPAAGILASRGLRVDSSVFKGGVQREHRLDYRQALRNGYYWAFSDRVDIPDARGALLEFPVFTRMVPFWNMLTAKRARLQRQGGSRGARRSLKRRLDFLRFLYPLKLDYCRLEFRQLARLLDGVIKEDARDPGSYRPIVAIGHSKDAVDPGTVDSFLTFLEQNRIPLATFKEARSRIESPNAP